MLGAPSGHGELILLAEDHRYVREIMATTLEALGYVVEQASDGPALLEELGYAPEDIAALFDRGVLFSV